METPQVPADANEIQMRYPEYLYITKHSVIVFWAQVYLTAPIAWATEGWTNSNNHLSDGAL